MRRAFFKQPRATRAFTLIELIVVIGIIAILAAIVIIAVNPAKQMAQARNADRENATNALYKATVQYQGDGNALPTSISTIPKPICDSSGGGTCGSGTVDIAPLVGKYISSVPKDPSGGTSLNTGYTIQKDSNGNIIVAAPKTDTTATTNTVSSGAPLPAPEKPTGLAMWLESDKGVFKDTNGTLATPGYFAGDPVAVWQDQSGNGHDAAQLNAQYQPEYNEVGGSYVSNGQQTPNYPVVDFSNSGPNGTQTSQSLQSAFSLDQPATVILVASSRLDYDHTSTFLSGLTADTTPTFDMTYNSTSTPSLSYSLHDSTSSMTGVTATDYIPHIFTLLINGGSSAVYGDGQKIASGSLSSVSLGGITLGRSDNSQTEFLWGDVWEVMAYHGILSDTDRTNVETYLRNKYPQMQQSVFVP